MRVRSNLIDTLCTRHCAQLHHTTPHYTTPHHTSPHHTTLNHTPPLLTVWQAVYTNSFNDDKWWRGKVLSMSDCGRVWVKFDADGQKWLMNMHSLELTKVRPLRSHLFIPLDPLNPFNTFNPPNLLNSFAVS